MKKIRLKKNKDIKNRSDINKNAQYNNSNNKDVKKLDKIIEFDKLVFLQFI